MSEKMYLKTQTMINDKTKMVSIKAVTSNSLRMYFYFYSTKIVKLKQGSGKDRQGMAVKAKGLKA